MQLLTDFEGARDKNYFLWWFEKKLIEIANTTLVLYFYKALN